MTMFILLMFHCETHPGTVYVFLPVKYPKYSHSNAQADRVDPNHMGQNEVSNQDLNTVKPCYLELSYFELPLTSKWKSGPCFNMKLWQQVTK